jgi:CxxC-x17-CxxC domain-containing protein
VAQVFQLSSQNGRHGMFRCDSFPSTVPEQRMEYHDRVLKCAECSAEFVFTAGEQMFFADKGFKNEPKRCKACKANRSAGNGSGSSPSVQRVETKTVCSQCGKETTVPFKPTQGRPVYCRECFQQRRTLGPTAATA